MTLLLGKRLIITGVVDERSIAFATAAAAQRQGAEVLLTAPARDLERCQMSAELLDGRPPVVEVDATNPADLMRLTDVIRSHWGNADGALHAIAYAPQDALAGSFVGASAQSTALAFQTSVHSYAALAQVLADVAPEEGASIVGLDFDASRAWPVYNWMGVCKAALGSASRYVARDLGPRGIRSNLVAAGPLNTRAASGIPAFQTLLDAWERAPLAWDADDSGPVADAICFLLSDLSSAITAEILHVDGGQHAMA